MREAVMWTYGELIWMLAALALPVVIVAVFRPK